MQECSCNLSPYRSSAVFPHIPFSIQVVQWFFHSAKALSILCSSSFFLINSPCVFQDIFPGDPHMGSSSSWADWTYHLSQAVLTQQLSSLDIPSHNSESEASPWNVLCNIINIQMEKSKWNGKVKSEHSVIKILCWFIRLPTITDFITYQNISLWYWKTLPTLISLQQDCLTKAFLWLNFWLLILKENYIRLFQIYNGNTVKESSVIGHFTDMGISLVTDLWRASLRK